MAAAAKTVPLEFQKDAVSLQYAIPTKRFTWEWAATVCGRRGKVLVYSAEFNVEKQCSYPEIPEATWKLSLEIAQSNGGIVAILKPLQVADNPNGILVEFTLSSSCQVPSIWLPDKPTELAEYRYENAYSLDDLVKNNSKSNTSIALYTLRQPQFLYVGLTFRITRRPLELQGLLDTGTFTDCTLIANDGRKFPAHRVILAAQSPVFLEMLKHSAEPPSNWTAVHLVDLSGDVLESLMNYLYSRGPIGATENLEELWIVANKYDIKAMKVTLEEMMVGKANKDNAWRYLDFAREHGLDRLQKKAAYWLYTNYV